MKLSNKQLFLLAGLFLATSNNAPENMEVPSNEGEWSNDYNELQKGGILDANFNLTGYGKFRTHSSCAEGVNFRKLALKNPKMAIAMLREGAAVIKELAAEGMEFTNQAYELFGEISADLGYIASPVEG